MVISQKNYLGEEVSIKHVVDSWGTYHEHHWVTIENNSTGVAVETYSGPSEQQARDIFKVTVDVFEGTDSFPVEEDEDE
jgi:hypothetical protein